MRIDPNKPLHFAFHKKLFIAATGIFMLLLVAVFLFQYNRESQFRKQQVNDLLQNYNYALLHVIETDSTQFALLGPLLREVTKDEMRVTVMDRSGHVLYDNFEPADVAVGGEGDLQTDRPEVADALTRGEGYAQRSSESIDKSFFYAAKADDRYVVRSALPYDDSALNYLKLDIGIIGIFIVIAILYVVIIAIFSTRLGRAIGSLREFAEMAENNRLGDIDIKLPNNDIGNTAGHIIRLYINLDKAKEELTVEKDKLLKHLQISNEGLAVFDAMRHVVVSNTLFIQYINVISDVELTAAEGVFSIHELEHIVRFLDRHHASASEYRTEQITIEKNGNTFTVTCALFHDGSFEININNITRQEEEARLKRQLTQNVAHELKTPVSSIRGFLETLLDNPQLDDATKRQFLERCSAQATRLSDLLKDISMLNRIDEAHDSFAREPVDIGKLVGELVSDSQCTLAERHMTVNVEIPSHTILRGNQLLLYSIFRNLLDNAIAYAGEGTHVAIRCYRQDAEALYFSFSDNGRGVGEEHLHRLFERFYRVDKGRSRKMGGTGLGLAIVKNAVLYHKGGIQVKNRPEGGLEVLFSLRREEMQGR